MFSLCPPFRERGGKGTPFQVWVGGYPISGLGRGTPSQVQVGGVPHPRSRWGTLLPPPGSGIGYPPQTWDGVPPRPGTGYHPPGPGTPPQELGPGTPPDLGPGIPPDQVWIRQSSTASSCYAAGGEPLAFTQEDFLVYFLLLHGESVSLVCFDCNIVFNSTTR